MKKPVLASLGIVVAAVAVVALGTQISHKAAKPEPIRYTVKQSCNILTKNVAQKIGGNNTTKKSSLNAKSSLDNTGYSSCTYGGKQGTVTLLVHSASNKAAADANAKQFAMRKPTEAQPVTGYGDAAYWDPTTNQLNILKRGVWYGINAGPSSSSKTPTLDQSKKLADLLADKL